MHGVDHESQHVVRTGVAEYAARRLANRGADGGDDVGVLGLFAHGILSFVVIPAEAGIQCLFVCLRFHSKLDPGSTHILVLSG